MQHHHPWRAFGRLTEWELRWADLPDGVMGETDHLARTVTLARGLSQAERRCTIAHETQHILRGPFSRHSELREELEVDRTVSRLLMPSLGRVVDALAWARGRVEDAADELWVDEFLLEVRLSALAGPEREYLVGRLDDIRLA